jgi:hypothetical protein
MSADPDFESIIQAYLDETAVPRMEAPAR